jgi:energy-coupling factor transport system permease protein
MRAAIAQYYPADSLLHRIDPRAKFIAVTAIAVALFTRDSFAALGVYAALAVLALAVSRVPLLWFWRGLKPVLWLVALTFVAQMLFARGHPLVRLGPLKVTTAGLELAGYLSLRLMVLVLIGSLLTLTTSPIALTDALAWLGRPLRRLRIPTEELALMITIALRFIPTLLAEMETIMRAQRARGADFSHGGPVRRARALVPVLVPLFVMSFRRADDLALAMEARCYRPGSRRSRMHPLRAGRADWVLLVVIAVVIVIASLVG